MNGDKSLAARAEGITAGLAGAARRLRDLAANLEKFAADIEPPVKSRTEETSNRLAVLRLFAQQVRSEADALAPAPHPNETKATKGKA